MTWYEAIDLRAQVFCSEPCRSWALAESSHALLCGARLSIQRALDDSSDA